MLEQFRTRIPVLVAVGFVSVILVCTAIFFIYDYFMVKMGLQLLQGELREMMVDDTSNTAETYSSPSSPPSSTTTSRGGPDAHPAPN